MARRSKDLASVSFHFLQRETEDRNGSIIPYTTDEFDFLCSGIENQPWPDFDDEAQKERLRIGTLVPLRNFERVNSRIASGTFQTSYSGHAYHNTEKGKISAQSLNQREFLYVLYLSDDGKIFVGAQYLGNYGGYETLKWGLTRHLHSRAGLRSYSFRRDIHEAHTIRPKEIRINIMASGRLDQDNVLTKKRVVVLQRSGGKDEAFEEAAREVFLPFVSSDDPGKIAALGQMLSANHLMSADDEDVQNCVLIADVDGREKRFHVIGDSQFATKLHLSVPYNIDGHPEYSVTAQAMVSMLHSQIIDAVA
ncbi:hypothetical protein Q4F19_19615 [Sphingomonas sp. BIUV-7]|uniref:GIY-YIG domain-containing protein n=1 Tax=Sphingomonas natans TaxID=3063330 RepID=A0ABT8YDZ6_9SPHN|nr:hypothetical protein [Sphingomonas sp. BIUV-7]